jgi:hypothetical protein
VAFRETRKRFFPVVELEITPNKKDCHEWRENRKRWFTFEGKTGKGAFRDRNLKWKGLRAWVMIWGEPY